MSLKHVELPIRAKMVLWSVTACSAILSICATVILIATHDYLYNRTRDMMMGILGDLKQEYSELGGMVPRFEDCIIDDVQEHGPGITQIVVRDPEGKIAYKTADIRKPEHHIRRASVNLEDGFRVEIYRNVEDQRDFVWFLAIVLIITGSIADFAIGVFAFLLGGRILKLNELVSEKNRAYEELRTLTDDIAHDLRTPLTRLNMAAENSMMRLGHTELAENVVKDTESMVDMINTMLEISQTDFRIDRTPREQVDLNEMVLRFKDLYETIAEDQGLKFAIAIPEEPLSISAHRAKLQQMIGNLLDNAIKFTRSGGRVSIEAKREVSGVRIAVKDTGVGIAAKDLPYIFKRFYRADSSRNLPGNGLGLALVHAIVTSYGGTIRCKSELGVGTAFIINLPQSSKGD